MASSTAFLDATRSRRTMYKITNESTISDNRIEQLVCHAIANIPSAFNTQSARIVVLLKQEHEKLWDISKEIFQKVIPADKWGYIEGRINGFRAGYGTILFFEDRTPIQEMQSKQPMVADKMPQWSEHSSGMHQYFLWTALEAEGLGCSLQHYNPAIDTRVQAEWKVPVEWDLKCQLVFGKPTAPPNEKVQKPVEERYRVYGK
ncbi:hypothetical protein MMC20_005389 [Loxospora ochrophaea]|nr:hypothetical protein [Loxospora ochrophaea]